MADIDMDVDVNLSEVPVNIMPLIDDTDFKSIEASVAYDAAGMALKWNFVTTAGAMTQTAVTPTTAGAHDWTSQGNGMYSLEIPSSAGTINNDTEGFGWFTGVATGVLPWRGPTIRFRAAGLNNLLIDDAYSATRGLAGTALPAAAADAAGGLPISDAGGLDMVAILADTNETQGKLPTNKIMGSSDVDNHDTDIDSILTDTNEIQGKLPTNKIMGSSDVDNHDTDIDAILADTGTDGVVVASASKTGYSLAADQSGVTIGTVNAIAAGVLTSIWGASLTGYSSSGTAAYLLREARCGVLGNVTIAGSTWTYKAEDGTTTLKTKVVSDTGRTVT